MVDAFTFDDGAPRRFRSRKEMYDWMAQNGHVILEGDDAPVFAQNLVRLAQSKDTLVASKAQAAAQQIADNSTHAEAIAVLTAAKMVN